MLLHRSSKILRSLTGDLTQFIAAALHAGNAAIVVATESHRESLLLRFQAHGLDIGTAIEKGRYIPLDAAAAQGLSEEDIVERRFDERYVQLMKDLIERSRE